MRAKKPDFYYRLTPYIKSHYNAQERVKPHTEKFKELMNRTEKIDEYRHFTVEEIEYLAKEDLPTFGDLFECEAYEYMSW